MQLIPVIDLYNNSVVHALRGQRDKYRPVESVLCHSSDPMMITESLMRLHHFSSIYIADLNAICNSGNNLKTIIKLMDEYPHLQFVIDCGMKALAGIENRANLCPVAGSETIAELDDIPQHLDRDRYYLSLDFSGTGFLGNPAILESPAVWPQNIIIMCLEKVGTSQGPDLERLASIRNIGGERNYYAAGGIQDISDLVLLDKAGVSGVLLATSLHKGTITGENLEQFLQH